MNSTRDNAAREICFSPMWPPLEKLGALLDRWQREHPETVQVSAPGESVQGRPVWAVRLTDLRINGHPVPPSELDGYLMWVARGNTYVQINIPPARLKSDDLFIVTCEYDPGEKRRHWQ